MSTDTTMKNLFDKEEVLELNLKNIAYEIKIYLKQLAEFLQQENIQDYQEKATWYQTVFKILCKRSNTCFGRKRCFGRKTSGIAESKSRHSVSANKNGNRLSPAHYKYIY